VTRAEKILEQIQDMDDKTKKRAQELRQEGKQAWKRMGIAAVGVGGALALRHLRNKTLGKT
jgi:hypothetical protein